MRLGTLNLTPLVSGTRSRRRRSWAICSLLISRNTPKNNKRLCRPSFTESQQSLFRSQYRIGCDSKPANHSLAKIRTNKMALVSAIILLSNRKWDFQKVSVFKALQPLMFTFFLFPFGKFKYRAAYLQWFYKQNIRKYVNDLRWYLRLLQFLVSK